MDNYQSLFGMRVFLSPDIHRYKLPERLPLSCGYAVEWAPGFRDEFNDWSREFLGTTNLLPDGEAFVAGNQIHMNPRTCARLQIVTQAQTTKEQP